MDVSRVWNNYFLAKISMNVTFLIILLLMAMVVVVYPYQGKFPRIQILIASLLIIGVCIGYWQWGSWESLTQYTRQQALLKSIKNPQELIDKFKQHLEKNPDSARGWFLLGRLYASQSRWSEARGAFHQAHLLDPNNEQINVNDIQSLWQTNHQVFNPNIRKRLQSILKNNPNQPDTLSMLAIDAFQEHDYQKAIEYWTQLLSLVPPDSVDAKAIRQAIAKAQKQLKQ